MTTAETLIALGEAIEIIETDIMALKDMIKRITLDIEKLKAERDRDDGR